MVIITTLEVGAVFSLARVNSSLFDFLGVISNLVKCFLLLIYYAYIKANYNVLPYYIILTLVLLNATISDLNYIVAITCLKINELNNSHDI